MCFVDSAIHRSGRYEVPYGTGSCTYCACICKGCTSFNFSILVMIYMIYRKKKQLHALTAKRKFNFFILLTQFTAKKLDAFTAKNIAQLDDFFVHDLHFSRCIVIRVILFCGKCV